MFEDKIKAYYRRIKPTLLFLGKEDYFALICAGGGGCRYEGTFKTDGAALSYFKKSNFDYKEYSIIRIRRHERIKLK